MEEEEKEPTPVGVCGVCGSNEYVCQVCDDTYCCGEGHKCESP